MKWKKKLLQIEQKIEDYTYTLTVISSDKYLLNSWYNFILFILSKKYKYIKRRTDKNVVKQSKNS